MAFGFGVGDLIALTNFLVDTIEAIHNAPKELQDLAETVISVQETLESIDGEPHHDAVTGDIIMRRKERIKEVLNRMQSIVIKYRDNKGQVNTLNKIKYNVLDKHEIADLVAKLEKRIVDLTTFLVLQTWRMNHQMRPIMDQILAGTKQQQERPKDQGSKRNLNAAQPSGAQKDKDTQITVPEQIDQVQAILDHVLQTEQPSSRKSQADQEDTSVEQELERQLGQAGINETFTNTLLEVMRGQRRQLTHPEDIDPISYGAGRKRLEVPKGWIMAVDSYNEVRSIIAQTYLELVRVWTVNNSGEQWLFNRVESAGVRVGTKFSLRCFRSQPKFLVEGGKPPESAALDAIAGEKSYFESEEKDDILARVGQHRSRGIDNWHFRKYEYMLCFDKSVYEHVRTLAAFCKERYGHLPSYANLSKVILVKNLRLKDAAANLTAKDSTKLVDSIKDGIKGFLDTEYHWKRPPLAMAGGPFRTKQIVLPNLGIGPSLAEKEVRLHEISTKTDCRIRVTDEKFDSQLFSITGRKEALSFASSLIREAFSQRPDGK